MDKYQREGHEVEARQVTASDVGKAGELTDLHEWSGAYLTPLSDDPGHGYLELQTEVGMMRAQVGDWIVHDEGGFYIVGPDEFKKEYEAIA